MKAGSRLRYLARVSSAYLLGGPSQLSFWHEHPQISQGINPTELGRYYMPFVEKSNYDGPFHDGVPLLDYRGQLGRQHNPIAISQFGLACWNRDLEMASGEWRSRWIRAAEWLTSELDDSEAGLPYWLHRFDWEYRDTLIAPWFSGLAQGQGVSLLVRAYEGTREQQFMDTAHAAMESLFKTVNEGGVIHIDKEGDSWIEEYIVDPPTHILNGFMWALWGVWDYYLATGDERAKDLWDKCVVTLKKNMHHYDIGWWSLYEQSGTRLKMIASPFYHRLHIVQLQVMERLTGDEFFGEYARRWDGYTKSWFNRKRAFAKKVLFKIFYY